MAKKDQLPNSQTPIITERDAQFLVQEFSPEARNHDEWSKKTYRAKLWGCITFLSLLAVDFAILAPNSDKAWAQAFVAVTLGSYLLYGTGISLGIIKPRLGTLPSAAELREAGGFKDLLDD